VSAVFAVKYLAGGRVQLGQAEDLGPAGMMLRWPREASLAAEGPLWLTFALPGMGDPLAARGLVVSDQRAGRFRRTGVRFAGLSADTARVISRYCEHQA
jgi:hypothetical protein